MTASCVDSFPVPLRLPAAQPGASTSKSAKGKQKQQPGQAGQAAAAQQANEASDKIDVVAQWTVEELQSVRRRVEMARKLGYSTILMTLSILPTTNPGNLAIPSPLFPEIDPRTAPVGTPDMILQLWKLEVRDYNEQAFKSVAQKGFYGFTNTTASLFPSNTALLSVVPTEMSSFSHIALSLSAPSQFGPGLITLDPSTSPRLPFPLKRGLVNTLLRNGMQIEIICRSLTRLDEPGEQPGDSGRRRRNWVAGAREIVRVCGGKGIVLSSGARKEGEMRGPADWRNLCSLIGLKDSQAKDALTKNPQFAIQRGLSLRQTFKGVISNPTLTAYDKEAKRTASPGPGETSVDESERVAKKQKLQ